MGCGCGKNNGSSGISGAINSVKNLANAAKTQPSVVKWFKDGVSGLVKCLGQQTNYSDEDIQKNRDVCRECEFSSKSKDGKLNATSQCLAIDPETGQQCGCYILCRTQVGPTCVLKKWITTPLTIKST